MAPAIEVRFRDLFSDQVQALDSAMLVAQTAVDKGPVHKLRTATRRLEAQLVLLDLLPGLPEHSGKSAEVHRLLRRVRRAAATVRDLDVQAEMIAADMPERAALTAGSRGDQDRKEARKLLRKLERRRTREAADLLGTLHAESEALAIAMQALQKAIAPEEATTGAQKRRATQGFRVEEVRDQIQQWFLRGTAGLLHTARHNSREHALQRLQRLNDDGLHDLRKAAKQCRYMAESLPGGSASAEKLSERFEYLQQTGGRWHDWLMLEELAARVFGKKSVLAERYRTHRNAALAEYHLQLALELTTGPQMLPRSGSEKMNPRKADPSS